MKTCVKRGEKRYAGGSSTRGAIFDITCFLGRIILNDGNGQWVTSRESIMNVRLTPRGEHLVRQYLARGRYHSPEEVIEHALDTLVQADVPTEPALAPKQGSAEAFEAFLDALAEYSDQIPPMPGETFSRGMIYQDHN